MIEKGMSMTENEVKGWLEYIGNMNLPYDRSPKSRKLACDAAIKALEEIQQYRAIGTVKEIKSEHKELIKLSRRYLKDTDELIKYQEIGTIEEFKVLKEKSVAKKAEVNEFDYGEGYVCGECESFLHYVDDDDEHIRTNYCCHCGTKIDWQ